MKVERSRDSYLLSWRTLAYRLCGVLFVAAVLAAEPRAQTQQDTEDKPVLACLTRRDFADPYVFKVGSNYYVFGTGYPGKFVSTKTFTRGDITFYNLDVDLGAEKGRVESIWAFRPYRHTDGTFHAYATLHYGNFRTVIAHLVPSPGETWTDDKPILKWKLDKILVGNVKLGNFAYDASMVRDKDGRLYLLYAAGSPNEVLCVDIHVKARRMLDPGNVDRSFATRTILSPEGLRSEDRNPDFVQIVEGPIVSKIGDKYALFYSVGDFTGGNYKIGVAWSDRLIPARGKQYTKTRCLDTSNTWANAHPEKEIVYLLQSEKKDWPNYVGGRMEGPGIANLVEVDGKPRLVFHGRTLDKDGTPSQSRKLFTLPVSVNVSKHRPMSEWITPLIPEPGTTVTVVTKEAE